MSLDGLRAWIGEVERKLGMRTKVMLVLAAIAIGTAGTAIYLVIDYRDKAVEFLRSLGYPAKPSGG